LEESRAAAVVVLGALHELAPCARSGGFAVAGGSR
jgi:hypothetical protein